MIFHGWATHEQIQAAVDSIDGEYVSGMRFGATYSIRVPDDGTIQPLRRAIERLEKMPQVAAVAPIIIQRMVPDYLRPHDGAEWRRWDVATHRGGHNWGWEAISAPLAWGCETGSPDVGIAVVDHGFQKPAELWANVDSTRSHNVDVLKKPGDPEHGTFVASVLAARGNDSTGITGGLWRARLRLFEVASVDSSGEVRRSPDDNAPEIDPDTAVGRLVRAAREGAVVIDLSMGTPWGPAGYDPGIHASPARRADIARLLVLRFRHFKLSMDSLAREGRLPLVVLSAGNSGIDARWNSLRMASDSLPNVIVVAAAEPAGAGGVAAWPKTNHGESVDVAAPGGAVYSLDRDGRELGGSGTSAAAPFVSAVAGLLVSFDPRLAREPARVKALIVQGARRGGKTIANGAGGDPIPLIDAYESLRLAATRPGTPVCGNAVWASGDTVFIQRDTVPGAAPEKVLVGAFADRLDVLHGGRTLRMRLPVRPQIGFRWASTGWAADPALAQARFADAVPGSGGAFLGWGDYLLGKLARSHDGDTTVAMVRGSGRSWDFTLFAGGAGRRLVSVADDASGLSGRACILRPLSAEPDTAQRPCSIETLAAGTYRGTGWSYAYLQAAPRAAPSARLLVAKTETRYTRTFGPWSRECPAMPRQWWVGRPDTAVDPGTVPTECRPFTTTARTVGTHYALFDLAGRVVEQWFDPAGETTVWGVSEDGRREMVTRYEYDTEATFGIVPFGYIATLSQTAFTDRSTCHLEERLLGPGGRTRWSRAACPNASTPTFGASRSADRGRRLLPEMAPGRAFADARRDAARSR
ncbi:MAG TPA: S8 family serine peptidase [Longimicrobium sp.]|nr:S8 family serine peptidase [Longimicrobium sp.]